MSAGDPPVNGRLKVILALVAALALCAGVVASSAEAGGTATAAKKCKKKRSAVSAKKKCKKKGPLPSAPIATPLPITKPPATSPGNSTGVTAATLTWDTHSASKADLDLHVWDSDGNHAGVEPGMMPGQVANNINGANHQGDSLLQTNGGEQFTDSLADEHEVTIGVCYGNADVDPPPTADWELEVNRSDGSAQTITPNNPFTMLNQTFSLSDGEPTSYQPTPTEICNGV